MATQDVHAYAFDQRAADEMKLKGWTTIQVELDKAWYFISFFDLTRLAQDLAQPDAHAQPCSDDNNLVIVSELTSESVAKSIVHLIKIGYFKRAWSEKVTPEPYGYEIFLPR